MNEILLFLLLGLGTGATIAAIARVLDDESLRRSLGAGAVRAARRKTWDAVADAQVAIYEEALEPG